MLPVARRRPVHAPLVSWANKAFAEGKALPQVAQANSMPTAPGDEPAPTTTASDDGVASALIAHSIKAGASVLTGILRDPQVQSAVATLLADALRQVAVPNEGAHHTATNVAEGPPSVAILGLTDQQSSEFARAYRGLMTLRFDRGTGVTSALRDAVSMSDVVIAMDGSVAQDVSRLLDSLAPSYVRHTNGLAGLRTRLADLAMKHAPTSGSAKADGDARARR